ncbi:hypothetical protein An02g11600 [Aspergillus niger]|uniref:Uncharacterized protein n=2 Tax=Aspergillus niger TaxID=5061 RepID=A2QEM5_ASPNC|nr:hypothetical protein An02g11600 [Aspergillus niger]CAK44486.1 hypothetical protein An02g11600 [Aspergillus niger]
MTDPLKFRFDVTCHKHLTSPDGLQLPKEVCAAECAFSHCHRHHRRRRRPSLSSYLLPRETGSFRRRVPPWSDLAAAPRSLFRRQHMLIAIRSILGAGVHFHCLDSIVWRGSRRPRTGLTSSVRLKRATGSSGHWDLGEKRGVEPQEPKAEGALP